MQLRTIVCDMIARLAFGLLLLTACHYASVSARPSNRRLTASAHQHFQKAWPGVGGAPHLGDKLQRVAVVNAFPFCHEIVSGLTYALSALPHTVEVYRETKKPAELGSVQMTSANDVLYSFHDRPIKDIGQLKHDAESFQLIVYADWYAPHSQGPPDISLRGAALTHWSSLEASDQASRCSTQSRLCRYLHVRLILI